MRPKGKIRPVYIIDVEAGEEGSEEFREDDRENRQNELPKDIQYYVPSTLFVTLSMGYEPLSDQYPKLWLNTYRVVFHEWFVAGLRAGGSCHR